MTHMSHSDYNVIDFNFVILTFCGKRHLIRVQHVKTMHSIGYKKQRIRETDSEFTKQKVNFWYIFLIDSEFAKQKVNLQSIHETDS